MTTDRKQFQHTIDIHKRRCDSCGHVFTAPTFLVADDGRSIAEHVKQYATCPICMGTSQRVINQTS
jgi:uncharacterized OB-fold protein